MAAQLTLEAAGTVTLAYRRFVMDGKKRTVRDRWFDRAEAAYRRMFEDKGHEELVTLTQRETMAQSIAKDLARFLLEEQVGQDPAAEPDDASSTCCPKCGEAGMPAVEESKKLPERTVTTLVGDIDVRRQRWACAKCRIVFFSVGRPAGSGDGGL